MSLGNLLSYNKILCLETEWYNLTQGEGRWRQRGPCLTPLIPIGRPPLKHSHWHESQLSVFPLFLSCPVFPPQLDSPLTSVDPGRRAGKSLSEVVRCKLSSESTLIGRLVDWFFSISLLFLLVNVYLPFLPLPVCSLIYSLLFENWKGSEFNFSKIAHIKTPIKTLVFLNPLWTMKRWQPAEKPQPERDSREGEGEMVGQSDTGPSDAFTFWLLDPPARMVLHSCTCICGLPGNPWARQRHSFLTTLLQCSETLGYEGLRFRPPTYHTSVPTLPNTSNPGPTSPVVFRCVRTTARVSPLSRDGQQPSACPASSGSSEQEGRLDPRPQVITQSPTQSKWHFVFYHT